GMGGRTRLVEAWDRHSMLCPAGDGTLAPPVGQPSIASVDRPSPHVRVRSLDVERALCLASQDLVVGQVRSALLQDLQVLGGQHFLASFPVTQVLGSVVWSHAEDLDGVVPSRSPTRIGNGGSGEQQPCSRSVQATLSERSREL